MSNREMETIVKINTYKEVGNTARKVETLGIISGLEFLDHAQELRIRVVWRLYAAILTYFSFVDDKEHSLATLNDLETFVSSKDMPVISDEDFEKVMAALDSLTEKERAVIVLRFGLDCGVPRKMEQIGKMLSVTPERIRQLEARALRKMRKPSRLCKLPALFGFVPPGPDRTGKSALRGRHKDYRR